MKKSVLWFMGFAGLIGSTVADVGDYMTDALSRTGWSATASHASSDAYKAFDNNLATRWTTGVPRAAGMWYKLDLGSVKVIDAVFLDMHTSTKDWPSGYNLEVSTDNSKWTLVDTATFDEVYNAVFDGELYIPFPWAYSARYVRMTLLESSTRNWSIHELYVSQGDLNANYPPLVSVCDEQVVPVTNSAVLTGSYIDDGDGGGPITATWSKVSGDGTVTFQNRTALNTTATFSSAGNYVLKLVVSDGQLSGTNSTLVYVVRAPSAVPRASNPVFKHMFTADPSAHVWADGRLYVYPSTDVSPPQNNNLMDGYHVFSTADMVTWIDHGEMLHSDDVPWGTPTGGFMWAPDCMVKNGTYFYYFPHPSTTNRVESWKIGVATSTHPATGFTQQGYIAGLDPIIDPCVYTDSAGQAYLMHGGGGICKVGKLKANMMEIDGAMTDISSQLPDFHEGPYVFKRGSYYYLMYPDNTPPCNKMVYAMSTNPMGPWSYKGTCILPTDEITMHGSIVEYMGKWWAFYHNKTLSGVGALRSVCFDEVFFNQDGTMQMIMQTIDPLLGVTWPAMCAESNLGATLIQLPAGDYTTAKLAGKGLQNDTLSSLHVPPGYVVELYANDNFLGTQWTVTSTTSNLVALGCNDVVSSLKVKLGPSALKYECESGALNICLVGSSTAASGGSYVRNFNLSGASITFSSISVPAAGKFYLNFTYGCELGTVVGLKVNNTFVTNLVCRNTGNNVAFNGNIRETVSLKAGANSLQLFMQPGSKIINPDYITLSPVPSAPAPGNLAPYFTSNPFSKPDASVGVAYNEVFSGKAVDPEGGAMTFSKVSGPIWLSVTTNGYAQGTPASVDVGTNSFLVKVTDNGGLSATATLTIKVIGVPQTVTFTSVAADDGYVNESSETSNVGGSLNSIQTAGGGLRIGDMNDKRQVKTVVSFDTTSIPDGAVILSATLKLNRGLVSGTPANLGTIRVDIKGGSGFNNSAVLENADFQAVTDATNVATMSYPSANGDWSTGSLNTTGLAKVNKTGKTQLRVYFATDDDNDAASDYLGFLPGDSTNPTNRPAFEITYQ